MGEIRLSLSKVIPFKPKAHAGILARVCSVTATEQDNHVVFSGASLTVHRYRRAVFIFFSSWLPIGLASSISIPTQPVWPWALHSRRHKCTNNLTSLHAVWVLRAWLISQITSIFLHIYFIIIYYYFILANHGVYSFGWDGALWQGKVHLLCRHVHVRYYVWRAFAGLTCTDPHWDCCVQVMQLAGLEGQQVVLLLEDYQFVHPAFLEMVNSLLSSGMGWTLFNGENKYIWQIITQSQHIYCIYIYILDISITYTSYSVYQNYNSHYQ